MNDNEPKITVRQLREMLFHLDNQDMTVEELRKALFDINNQDLELISEFTMWEKLGVE